MTQIDPPPNPPLTLETLERLVAALRGIEHELDAHPIAGGPAERIRAFIEGSGIQ